MEKFSCTQLRIPAKVRRQFCVSWSVCAPVLVPCFISSSFGCMTRNYDVPPHCMLTSYCCQEDAILAKIWQISSPKYPSVWVKFVLSYNILLKQCLVHKMLAIGCIYVQIQPRQICTQVPRYNMGTAQVHQISNMVYLGTVVLFVSSFRRNQLTTNEKIQQDPGLVS